MRSFVSFKGNLPTGKPHVDSKSRIIEVAKGVFSLGFMTQVHPVQVQMVFFFCSREAHTFKPNTAQKYLMNSP